MRDEEGRPQLKEGLLGALARVYSDVLRRQGRTTTPFVRWSAMTGRAHEFVWLGGVELRETLLHGAGSLHVPRSSPLFDAVQKMHATLMLNPYEREVLYGYPYVVGRRDGDTIRGPLLTLAVSIEPKGDGFDIQPSDDVVHFNALPFKPEGDVDLHEHKLGRVIDVTPSIPIEQSSLERLVDVITREFQYVDRATAVLDGRLALPPSEPRGSADDRLHLLDQSALFIAPKTSYFLVSDLERIGASDGDVSASSLGPLLAGPGAAVQIDLDDDKIDSARVFFPFPSNRSQRRVALLVDDPTTQVVRVEGRPARARASLSQTWPVISQRLARPSSSALRKIKPWRSSI